MSNKVDNVAHEVIVHYGLNGSIRVDEESLFASPKVQKQIAAAEELAQLLGLVRVGGQRAVPLNKNAAANG